MLVFLFDMATDVETVIIPRARHTNHQVERHIFQLRQNLFVACGYCNNKKSNKYDDILDPTQYDIETIIEHSNDFVNQKAIFDSDNRTSEVLSTIKLLNLLFNGKLSYRNCREQRFYDEFIQKMNFFSYVVDEYMSGEKEYYYPVIKEQLDIRSEYLGFKYAIIHSNDLLKHDFGDMTIWNKKGE